MICPTKLKKILKQSAKLFKITVLLLFSVFAIISSGGAQLPKASVITVQTNIKRGGGFCAFCRQDHAFILTCAHVVEDAVFVSVNGKKAEVVYFKHNKEEDLALLKVYNKDASFVPIAIADELNSMDVYCYYFNGYKIKSYDGKLLTTKKTLVSIPQGEKGQSGAPLLQNGFVVGVASALDKEENAEALISQRVTNSKLNEIQEEIK